VSSGLVLNVRPTLMTPDASELEASKGKSGCLSSGFEYHSCNQLVWNFGAIEMKDSSLCTFHLHLSTRTLKHLGTEHVLLDPPPALHPLPEVQACTQTDPFQPPWCGIGVQTMKPRVCVSEGLSPSPDGTKYTSAPAAGMSPCRVGDMYMPWGAAGASPCPPPEPEISTLTGSPNLVATCLTSTWILNFFPICAVYTPCASGKSDAGSGTRAFIRTGGFLASTLMSMHCCGVDKYPPEL